MWKFFYQFVYTYKVFLKSVLQTFSGVNSAGKLTDDSTTDEYETYRMIPNACLAKGKTQQCKHEAPWTKKLNDGDQARPLLICPGIAKKRDLRCSGTRNMVGSTLFVRNNEWLDGTIPGLCIALGGSNTDVQPNDLLPILPETHEDEYCRKSCTKRSSMKKLARKMIRIQATRNGYFGGYINKRQPAGDLETKKCVDKMYTLRQRSMGKSEKDKFRAVTGRMITDIEMNGTIRGSVEVFNLASNLHDNDVLFAEFIRTFATRDVDGRAWQHRMAVELQTTETTTGYISLIPATTRPHVRTTRGTPPYPECYGFRPPDAPWHLLCAYEFMMFWRCEALVAPYQYKNMGQVSRTKLTPLGTSQYENFVSEEKKKDAV